MKPETKVILGVTLAGLGYYFFRKVRALGNLIFSPGPITDIGYSGGTPFLTILVTVQNTSSIDLMIQSFAGNVFSDNQLIGNVSTFMPTNIPANAMVQVPVVLQLKILGIVNDIVTAWQYKNKIRKLEVDGFVNAGNMQIPIDLKLTVGEQK